VVRVGVGLNRWSPDGVQYPVVVCGLAGSLLARVLPGTVLVPTVVGLEDGRRLPLDQGMSEALSDAAEGLGYRVERGDMLTSRCIVTGEARVRWAAEGFAGADMETGILAAHGLRVATIRVVLDTPTHPISDLWTGPRAALSPGLLRELIWMARYAPAFALRSAGVVRVAGL